MKTQIVLLAVIVAVLATGSAYAANDDGNGKSRRNMFEQIDANGDGRVDKQEFAKAREIRFGRMDADGDGAVTLAELEDRSRRERTERLFGHIDADGDGRVTMAEFTAAGDKMFARLDGNEDGFLSMGELERRRHRDAPSGESRN